MRGAAGNDYGRALEVQRWPIREVLIAYLAQLRAHALEDYRHGQLLWQVRNVMGGKRASDPPPPVPRLLKGPAE